MNTKIYKHFLHLFLLLLLTLFWIGCGKDNGTGPVVDTNPTGTMTFTLNGGGFTNKAITLKTAIARYDVEEQMTAIFAAGVLETDSIVCGLVFPGNRTGTFVWSTPENGFGIVLSQQNVYLPLSGTTTVSSYGPVGSTVSGSFSGKIIRMGTYDTVTVSNGQFSARHIQ